MFPPPPASLSPRTSHLSPRTSHLSPRTSHLSPHTSHLSPRTSHLSPHAPAPLSHTGRGEPGGQAAADTPHRRCTGGHTLRAAPGKPGRRALMTVTPHQRCTGGHPSRAAPGNPAGGRCGAHPWQHRGTQQAFPSPLVGAGAAEAEITPSPPTPTPSPTWGEGSNVPPLPLWERGAGG